MDGNCLRLCPLAGCSNGRSTIEPSKTCLDSLFVRPVLRSAVYLINFTFRACEHYTCCRYVPAALNEDADNAIRHVELCCCMEQFKES